MDDDEEFKSACSNRVAALRRKGAHLFLVCVDGSDQADVAFHSIMNVRRKYDYIAIFHAFRGDREPVQSVYKPHNIEEKYECQLVGALPADQFSLHLFDRKGKEVISTLKVALSHYSSIDENLPDDVVPDFIVVGHHGRKGAKSQHTALGSTTDLALRSLHVPIIVMKTELSRGPKSFVMAVNGTQVSKHGLDILLRLVNSRDSITLIYYQSVDVEGSEADPLRDYYEGELEEYGPPDSKLVVHHTPRDLSVKEAITNFVNDSNCDFFAIAPRAKRQLSNVSDYVINHVFCNVVLCKN